MFAMLVAYAVAVADSGTTEPQPAVPVITPEQLEPPASLARLNRTDFVVRFRVKSAAAASRPDKAFVLWADAKFEDLYQGEGQPARPSRDVFRVDLSPKAQAELAEAGVTDLKKHFAGREVEVRGRVEAVVCWCFPALTVYSVRVERAEQIRAVR